MNIADKQKEIENNENSLKEKLRLLEETRSIFQNKGRFAVMRSGEILQYFSTMEDAFKAGRLGFPDDMFSVHKIEF